MPRHPEAREDTDIKVNQWLEDSHGMNDYEVCLW